MGGWKGARLVEGGRAGSCGSLPPLDFNRYAQELYMFVIVVVSA